VPADSSTLFLTGLAAFNDGTDDHRYLLLDRFDTSSGFQKMNTTEHACCVGEASLQGPVRPVAVDSSTLLIPYAPGTGTDVTAIYRRHSIHDQTTSEWQPFPDGLSIPIGAVNV